MTVSETVQEILNLRQTMTIEDLSSRFSDFKNRYPKLFEHCITCIDFDLQLLEVLEKKSTNDVINNFENDMEASLEIAKRFFPEMPKKESIEKAKKKLRNRCGKS